MNKEYLKERGVNIFNKIKNDVVLITKGEFSFPYMLYLWGALPAVILILFLQRLINSINNKFISTPIIIFLAIYFSWHLISLRKALKVHPEYRPVKENKKDLYKDKTSEEISEIKKEKAKERIQKALLLKAWDSTPNYILVGCLDAYVILTQLQRLLIIIGY